mmetsp:Transcript_25618/g.72396  ORF Transcript_25618/g.72396 Transcript_25618/m.72396 type:complete len:109 (-) Transcript_25618:18-344(-)|eukprot:CAMPEP_0179292712 /NCGR_PEP_ID=MMETSP0797-20121207/42996_1 /TAXON_ID=47934 /ORGANISM="Dinophysis acuminata, Strain DAEP01" /LENGTH=108 /DNA_ID=CAMNT_0021001831 /DNA_START=68 /DNA_END=394 /DNA_ORIENTATION=+
MRSFYINIIVAVMVATGVATRPAETDAIEAGAAPSAKLQGIADGDGRAEAVAIESGSSASAKLQGSAEGDATGSVGRHAGKGNGGASGAAACECSEENPGCCGPVAEE